MRIVNFVDFAESETAPTIGNIVASNLVQYPDDTTYETNEQGAPARGNIYYNTTDDTIRFYNGTIWQELIDESTTQALENKSIDADNNLITNIDNNEIKPLAGIEATKIADGSVDDVEFQYLNGVTSPIQTQLDSKINNSEKGAANGVATLDGAGRVPASQLPSYVDDVLEYANLAAFPVTGETGKIYVALDNNKTYRWTGSVYVEVGPASQANNGILVEGGSLSYIEGASVPGDLIEQALNNSNASWDNTFYVAQTFTPSTNFTVNSTAFIAGKVSGLTGNMTMEIWGTTGGDPDSSNVLGISNPVDASTFPVTPSGFFTFTFSTPVNLLAGTQYALVINPSATSGANYVTAYQSSGNPYAGGLYKYSNNIASTPWSNLGVNVDLAFRVTQDASFSDSQLTFGADAYVLQEGFSPDRNTIQAQTVNIPNGDDLLYVTVNKTVDSITNLTVNSTSIDTYSPGDNDLIIGYKDSGGIEIGRKLYLKDGESAELEDGLSPHPVTITQENIGFIGQGTASWDSGTGDLVLDTDCYLSVPPLLNDRHTIQAQTINLSTNECAYVVIDRNATITTNLTVNVDLITNVTPDNSKVIFAREFNGSCYIGLKDFTKLDNGDTYDLQKPGGTGSTKTLIQVYRDTNLNTSAAGRVQITGYVITFDSNSEFTANQFVPATGGIYRFDVYFESETFDGVVDVEFDVNSSAIYDRLSRASGVSTESAPDGRGGFQFVELQASDVVKFYVYAQTLVRTVNYVQIGITKIS